jgi:Sulfotransferase family
VSLNDSLIKPIIVVGAPRSGTTNLGRILSGHPAVAYAAEPRLTWRYGNDGKSDMLLPEDARPEVVRHIRETFAGLVRDENKQRLLEKTPSTALRLAFVDKVMPDCKVIHIIRNGRESALAIKSFWEGPAQGFTGLAPGRIRQRLKEVSPSRLPYYAKEVLRRAMPGPLSRLTGRSVWGPRIPGIEGLVRDLSLIEVCALQWRTSVELACHYGRTMPADRYKEVRIEQMSPGLLGEMLEFCGLEHDQGVCEGAGTRYDPARAGRRIKEAGPDEIDKVDRWIGPTMKWLGYD